MLSIEVNGFQDRVYAFGIALGRRSDLRRLAVTQLAPGGSFHFEKIGGTNRVGERATVMTFSMDDFRDMFREPSPTHLKIDVPMGLADLLAGGERTLADPRLREIWVELGSKAGDFAETRELLDVAGFQQVASHAKKSPTVTDVHFVRGPV